MKDVILDPEDEHLRKFFNVYNGRLAAVRRRNGRTEYMHRVITSAPTGMFVDHINGNPLDNRRSNLRVCTNAENLRNRGKTRANTSGYKGVWFNKIANFWYAALTVDGCVKNLGNYSTAEAAALAYNKAVKKYHGNFAKLNKVD